jgi:hypothetical protein
MLFQATGNQHGANHRDNIAAAAAGHLQVQHYNIGQTRLASQSESKQIYIIYIAITIVFKRRMGANK